MNFTCKRVQWIKPPDSWMDVLKMGKYMAFTFGLLPCFSSIQMWGGSFAFLLLFAVKFYDFSSWDWIVKLVPMSFWNDQWNFPIILVHIICLHQITSTTFLFLNISLRAPFRFLQKFCIHSCSVHFLSPHTDTVLVSCLLFKNLITRLFVWYSEVCIPVMGLFVAWTSQLSINI